MIGASKEQGPAPSGVTPDPLALAPADRAWVERTLAGLSTEARIAQLFVLSSSKDSPEEVAELSGFRPGGIHRFPTHDLAAAWRATRAALDAAEVPLILSGDIEGGMASYAFTTHIPNQMGIAACDDLALSARLAAIVARESQALGYNWSFTPVVDVNRAFRSAVVGTRSYGSSVETIIAQARAYVGALQSHGIAATAKHWPGDGIDDRDQHLATSVNSLDLDAWEASFGRIYRALIADGLMTVMSAHIALPALVRAFFPDAGREAFRPGSVSRLVNEHLLRERLGFRGLVVSDATVMGGLTSWMDREEAVPAVIENGCDVFLFSRDPGSDMALMRKGLREGRLSEARLDAAARRMLTLKARLGLHRATPEQRLAPLDEVRERMRRPADLETARRAAGQGQTLVKDSQALLPLDPVRHRRVTVITDPGWSFISGALDRSFDPFFQEMRARGFEIRAYDPERFPTRADTDLVLYLIGQEATPAIGSIRLDFARLHGGTRKAMEQFNREIPTLLVSLGEPYYLRDAPNFSTYVNGYCALEASQRELVRRLTGEAAFTGRSPVDAFCGLEQLQW